MMFSTDTKRKISEQIQKILRDTNDPELPDGEIEFTLHVHGAREWSYADIKNNGAVKNPGVNHWNEIPSERRKGFIAGWDWDANEMWGNEILENGLCYHTLFILVKPGLYFSVDKNGDPCGYTTAKYISKHYTPCPPPPNAADYEYKGESQ